MVSRRKEPRVKLVTEVPLDDGPRDGSERWRVIDGVEFCHWDRWLLRLAMTEPQGLDTIAREFRTRASRGRGSDAATAEAMLAQIVDLKARLERVGRPTPVARPTGQRLDVAAVGEHGAERDAGEE